MFDPYMFVINSVPAPENRYYNKVGGAAVHIWVMDTEAQSALDRAKDYIRRFQWEPQEVEYAFQIDPARVDGYHKQEVELYRQAVQFGIAAMFVGWQKEDHPGDPTLMLPPK